MANIKSIGGNPIVLGLDGLSDEVTHGYNPSLSVGRADALTGADETAQWAQRTTEGSGTATVRSVQGAAVAWNQMVVNGNFESASYWAGRESAIVIADGVATITPTSDGTARGLLQTYSAQERMARSGHKYYIAVTCKPSAATNLRLSCSGITEIVISGLTAGVWTRCEGFWTPTQDTAGRFYALASATLTTADTLQFKDAILVDLTAMFGSGNEPSTVAEFEAMYPEAYYPYSAPTLKPVQIAGIRSTDAQGGELDAIEWTAQTLRSAGSVRDELTAGELVTRVGVVQATGGVNFVEAGYDGTSANVQVPLGLAATAGLNFNSDQFVKPSGDGAWRTLQVGEARVTASGVWMGLPADITTNAQANAWMAEHKPIFWYALATPTTTPISPALPMTYKVQQGGTESIIVPTGEISAAPVLTIAEGESAADVVMDALACIAAPDGPVATANHAQNTYLTMGGKLYKVTSAIAVGETITAGTNVTQTTVMAELIARTA